MTEELFSTTNICRICASVYSPNVPSMRVLEKAGYNKEAILKRSILKNGQYYDEHVFVIFRHVL